jgi:hypothetical protein
MSNIQQVIISAESALEIVDIETLGADLQRIGHRLAGLGQYLEQEADINITHLDDDYTDLTCGDISDELFMLAGLVKKLIDAHSGILLENYLRDRPADEIAD